MARRQRAPTGRTGRRPPGRHSPPQAGGGKNLQFRAGARRSGYCDMFPSNRPRYCDMFTPQIPLLRHVHSADRPTATCSRPADPATATCSPRRPRYCDMFTPQIGLLRHVHPTDRATATCSRPTDPAIATCSPRRSRYCDMFAPSRLRYCDMFTPQIGLPRHVRIQPTPLLRHVHPADPATATCPSPGRLVHNGVSGQRRRAVTGGNLQLDFSTSPP